MVILTLQQNACLSLEAVLNCTVKMSFVSPVALYRISDTWFYKVSFFLNFSPWSCFSFSWKCFIFRVSRNCFLSAVVLICQCICSGQIYLRTMEKSKQSKSSHFKPQVFFKLKEPFCLFPALKILCNWMNWKICVAVVFNLIWIIKASICSLSGYCTREKQDSVLLFSFVTYLRYR